MTFELNFINFIKKRGAIAIVVALLFMKLIKEKQA